MAPDPRDPGEGQLAGQLRAELLDRFTSPFYAFAAGLIAFAALGEARTTRQGRGWAIVSAVLVFAAVRLFGITASLLMRGKGDASPPLWVPFSVWAIPLFACAASLDAIFGGPLARGLQTVRLVAGSAAARR